MGKNRVLVPVEQISNGRVKLSGTEVKYLSRVLRLSSGDLITVFDGLGNEYMACIQEISHQQVLLRILEEEQKREGLPYKEPPLEIVLCQSLPKGDKMEMVLQKGTELGSTRFIPLETERTIVRLDSQRAVKRHQRWQKIVSEAARQSRRTVVPQVDTVRSLVDVLKLIPHGVLSLIPWEAESVITLKEVIHSQKKPPQQVWVFIGPEGGFTEQEVNQAKEFGAIPVTLGPRILRTETAGLAVLVTLLYEWGDLGGS